MTPAEARARFPVLERRAYLNAGTAGPLSLGTHRAMVEWEERALTGGRGHGDYFRDGGELSVRLLVRLGALLTVPVDHLLLTTSTTEGCNLVVTGLRLGPDDEVVITDAEHPGLEAPVRASRAGVRVAKVLGRPAEEVVAAVLAEVTPRTRLIALSHVLWLNGQVLPLAEIRRATGVPLLVDGAQSAGAIPVQAAEADFYAVSGQKWLCGPELTGALYVADPERLHPPMAGYMAMHGDGAQRLVFSHHPASARAGLLAAIEERPEWAFARGAEMAQRCRAALEEAGLPVHTPPGDGTIVSITPPGVPETVVARCLERDVLVRSLPNGWLRISCGWWTSDEDISRLVDALRD
ncbi:MAG TPA: aminotransferase class V-fold PLP-dependent enzyme [Candidatus Dormibacteraeota bacterium]